MTPTEPAISVEECVMWLDNAYAPVAPGYSSEECASLHEATIDHLRTLIAADRLSRGEGGRDG